MRVCILCLTVCVSLYPALLCKHYALATTRLTYIPQAPDGGGVAPEEQIRRATVGPGCPGIVQDSPGSRRRRTQYIHVCNRQRTHRLHTGLGPPRDHHNLRGSASNPATHATKPKQHLPCILRYTPQYTRVYYLIWKVALSKSSNIFQIKK